MKFSLSKMQSITKRLNSVVSAKRRLNDDYDLETNLYRKTEVEKSMGKTELMDPTETMEIINKTQEFLESGGADAKKKIHKLLDFNKDGVIDRKDLKEFGKTVLCFSLVVYGILLYKERDNLLTFIQGGDWIGLASFLETAIVLQGFVIILSFFYQKFQKQIMDDDKKVKEAELKTAVLEEEKKSLLDQMRQQQLKFELEQYRNNVRNEINLLQYTTDAEIVIKVKDAIARLEMEYNNRLQKLLQFTQSDANAFLDMSIQDLPNIEKTGVVDSIVTIPKQETQSLCKEPLSSVPEVPKNDKPSETLNQTTDPKP